VVDRFMATTRPSLAALSQLSTVRLTEANVSQCESLWGDRVGYSSTDFSEVMDRARWLLSTDRARGAMFVERDQRVRGFGLAAFVHEDLVAKYVACPYPQLGRSILLHPELGRIILGEDDVGLGNAGRGLDLVILNQGFDLTGFASGEWQRVAGTSMQAFFDLHRGYRVARLVNEIFGDEGVGFLERVGLGTIYRFVVASSSGAELNGASWTVTREHAEREGGFILPMFAYSPPFLGFTSAERHLLRMALSGKPDDEFARALHVPVSAVKGRWRRIQQRAVTEPELRAQIEAVRREQIRGPQWRHLILEYVRAHPSELTPYKPEAHPIIKNRS
jgi:hypothetical protein